MLFPSTLLTHKWKHSKHNISWHKFTLKIVIFFPWLPSLKNRTNLQEIRIKANRRQGEMYSAGSKITEVLKKNGGRLKAISTQTHEMYSSYIFIFPASVNVILTSCAKILTWLFLFLLFSIISVIQINVAEFLWIQKIFNTSSLTTNSGECKHQFRTQAIRSY
jgi:hypothetical protein